MIRTVPQQFYENPDIKKIFVDGLSCIIHKRLDEPTYGKEGFISTHVITYVRQGVLRVENEDGLFVEVVPGKMVFMPKGLYTISDIIPKGGYFDAMMFFMEPEVIRQFLGSLNFPNSKEKSITNILIEGNGQTRFFAESLLQLYSESERPNRQLTKMKLFELLHLVHHSYGGNQSFVMSLSTLDNKEKKSLREFMQANFHKPLGIEDYAYLTGRSISTFTRDFKSRFGGMAPKQWLIEQRLEKARQLLEKNHVNSITEVAGESGYTNVPHFIKEFHKRYGITPKQFLIENRKGVLV